jgi:hypothetical protein
MFHRGFAFIGVTALLLGAGPARGGGDHHDDDGGDFEEQVQIKAALTLARAADANDNGAVTGG